MDLREVIAKVKITADGAHSSFHAGRRDDAEKYLMVEMRTIARYFDGKTTPAGDINESATSEKPAEVQTEKQAEVPGAQVRPAEVGPVLPASQFGGSLTDEKPTQ